MRKIVVLGCMLALAGLAGAAERIEDPTLVASSRISPEFPPSALAARLDATVVLAVAVNADGSVGEVEVLESTRPNLGFERSAIDAMRQWRFEPATNNGEAVPSVVAYSLTFVAPPRGAGGSPYVSGFNMASTVRLSRSDPASPGATLNNEFKQKTWYDRERIQQQLGQVGPRRSKRLSAGFQNDRSTDKQRDGQPGNSGF